MSRRIGSADRFLRLAKAEGYVARSAYKLLELQKKFRVIPAGGCVLDLGCCPGSWLQVACQSIGPPQRGGRIVGLDIQDCQLPERHIDGYRVHLLHADVRIVKAATLRTLLPEAAVGFDAVLSDMAPSTSGIAGADAAKSLDLAQCAADLALGGPTRLLAPRGNLVVKLFEGQGMSEFIQQLKPQFQRVVRVRPETTRRESREIYVVGLACHDA